MLPELTQAENWHASRLGEEANRIKDASTMTPSTLARRLLGTLARVVLCSVLYADEHAIRIHCAIELEFETETKSGKFHQL